MWGLYHPAYEFQRWHVLVIYVFHCWACAWVVLYGNALLPRMNQAGAVFLIGGLFVTVLVCVIMPSETGSGYATSYDVWRNWQNQTGWSSNGFVFLIGMLNGE